MTDRLTVSQAAALAGIKPATWRSYVSRGQAPAPIAHLDARTPVWDRAEVKTWIARRDVSKRPHER